jgi:hypothetical protein
MKTRKQTGIKKDATMKNNKLAWIFVAVVAAVFAGPMVGTGATPTVDGLFYASGDYANYSYLGADPGRGTLYYHLDGNTLYVAVVVSNTVNDNVFGDKGDAGDQLYLKSAGWEKKKGKGFEYKHKFKELVGSDHAEFELEVGSTTWTWKQDYLYDADNDKDPTEADWLSDINGNDGAGTAPPGLVSASSLPALTNGDSSRCLLSM